MILMEAVREARRLPLNYGEVAVIGNETLPEGMLYAVLEREGARAMMVREQLFDLDSMRSDRMLGVEDWMSAAWHAAKIRVDALEKSDMVGFCSIPWVPVRLVSVYRK